MIAYFLEKLGSLLERSEQYRREAYLASSAPISRISSDACDSSKRTAFRLKRISA